MFAGIALTDPVHPSEPPVAAPPEATAPRVRPGYGKAFLMLGGLLLVILVIDMSQRTDPRAAYRSNPVDRDVASTTTKPVAGPRWTRSGSGDDVFDMPSHVRRVRILATYSGDSANFIVEIAGENVVNDLLGTQWDKTQVEGTYLTRGGTVAITRASGVSWSFEEVR